MFGTFVAAVSAGVVVAVLGLVWSLLLVMSVSGTFVVAVSDDPVLGAVVVVATDVGRVSSFFSSCLVTVADVCVVGGPCASFSAPEPLPKLPGDVVLCLSLAASPAISHALQMRRDNR